jgi:hypothetical protein
MNNKLTKREREHFALIKSMPCSVCGQSGPSEAHHIRQHLTFTCIPLCYGCHRDNFNGIHGQKRIWNVMKKDELICLDETIRALLDELAQT